jgi:pre-mRNA-processing factor 39
MKYIETFYHFFQNNIDSARKAFEAFLSHYPFCYGYWKKFADMEKKNGDLDRSREVLKWLVE